MTKSDLVSAKFTRPCAVCESIDGRLLLRQSFSELSGNGSLLSSYDIVVCDKCGFCFADNIPDQMIFDSYYRDMSKYEKVGRVVEETTYDRLRFQLMANKVIEFLNSNRTRIFEIGCANGQLLSLLKKEGYENVSGVDPSPLSAKIVRERYGIEVSANTLSGLSGMGIRADFVIMAGVLEHVRDLSSALQTLRQILSENGSVFITVPDASRYVEGEDAPFQEFSVEHINYFGHVSLANLMSTAGFAKISIQQDMIESSYRTTTPVIHGVFMKTDIPALPKYMFDEHTWLGLRKYISRSTEEDGKIQESLNKIADSGKSIIVWGTGAHTLRLLATSRLGSSKITAFVDSNPRYQGKTLNGSPIIAPQVVEKFSDPILISSRAYQEEIASQIQNELRLKNEIVRLY